MRELVQNKNIYRRATFWSRYFYIATAFSEQILFQQRYFFERATFSHGDIILNIVIVLLLVKYYISIFFRKATFWKKLIFQKSNIPHYLLFLKSHFSIAGTFSEELLFKIYFFRRGTISQLRFLSPAHCLFTS